MSEAAFHQAEAMDRLNRMNEEVRKNHKSHNKRIQDANKATGDFKAGLKKATGRRERLPSFSYYRDLEHRVSGKNSQSALT